MRHPLCAIVLLCPALAAQTTVSLVSTSPISVLTSETGSATFDTVPVNTPIGAWPNAVSLSTSQNPTGKFLSASTSIYPGLPYQDGIAFNFFERASCRGVAGEFAGSSASPAAAGATLGVHGVLATFAAAPGTRGNLRISLLANAGTNGTAHATVDVGNDSTIEFAQGTTGSLSIPFTFGPSGQVVVAVTNQTSVPGVGLSTFNRSYSDVSVGFWPDLTATCTFSTYGQGCGGVAAAGNELVNGPTRNLIVQATGCVPNSPAIVATGANQLNLPLLGGCSLLCTAESLLVLTADASGNLVQQWSVPSTLVGTIFVQVLPLTLVGGNLVITASNGVRIHCFR